MKRLDIWKTIQFIVFLALALFCLYKVHFDPNFSSSFAESESMRMISFLLWLVLGLVFIFIFIDFTLYANNQKEMSTLKRAINSDVLSNLANRNSCDELVLKYEEAEIGDEFTCIMLEINNLKEINEEKGRAAGNRVLKEFSAIVYMASVGKGFVGRNGGNKYLALFENDNGKVKGEQFLKRITDKIEEYNGDTQHAAISFKAGVASGSDVEKKDIHKLISLADRRLGEQK